uniref:Integrase catalytic domain-containing protein n=1 Tax=Tanacetum cinerariifolium TaxID=118510 RepID=A0A6L2NAM1_TANCI|nr:hypothetical protein [Tanacetum cinerariifolium]
MFTNNGYTWRPTGWTFTIVGNACPLNRITTTSEVPFRKPIALKSDTPKPMVGISHETSIARSPQQNGVIERRNHTLIEAARTMLIYAKALLFLWAEAVATACYTQNRSIIRLCHDETPLVHDKPPDLLFFHVFGALCYPTNNSENLNFDELTAMAFKESSSGPALYEMAPAIISSGLVPNPPPSTLFVPPSRTDWDMLFQPLVNELLTPPPSFDHPDPEVIAAIAKVVALEPAGSTGLPSTTTVDQDAPLPTMQEELNEFERLEVWELVPRADKVMVITLKWIYKVKLDELGGILKNKARLVARNYHREDEIDFEESFTLPARRVVDLDNLNHVYKVKKALYGLKQAPCAWYDMLSSFLISQDFSKGLVDPTLFIRKDGKELLLVQIYVDDIIFAASTPELCNLFAKIRCSKFKMSMMGKISIFLGLQISQSPRGIFINQSKYALESLKKYGFDSCDPVDTPMVEKSKLGTGSKKYGFDSCDPMDTPIVEKSKLDEDKKGKTADPSHYHGMIGTLLYLTANRPDLRFSICMSFADADHAGYQDTRRSTYRSMEFLGDRLVSGSSKRQKSAAISGTEVEYIALSGCCAQVLWMRSQLTNYGLGFKKILMYSDNKSTIALCCNNVQHSRSKHIDIRFYFIKEHVENGVIELYFINTEYLLAYIFTKALGRERIEFLINKSGMQNFTSEILKTIVR